MVTPKVHIARSVMKLGGTKHELYSYRTSFIMHEKRQAFKTAWIFIFHLNRLR
jgi:hypothetical protein